MLKDGRTISLEADVMFLKAVVRWYNNNPQITKEELYEEFYGSNYQTFMDKGSLEKYLER